MKVLVLAPHPDDETLGCGGALCLHADKGEAVSVVFLTSGELGLKSLPAADARTRREAEAGAAAAILGVHRTNFLKFPDWMLDGDIPQAGLQLAPILRGEAPDLVYVPHSEDAHPDHRATLPILRRALGECPELRPQVRAYEVWSPLSVWDHAVDISAVFERKMRAFRAHKSQLDTGFDYARAITGLNQYRGALATKTEFAEVFADLFFK